MTEEWESGPFCGNHWADVDCSEPCVCGHPCKQHDANLASECSECDCKEFRDVPDLEVCQKCKGPLVDLTRTAINVDQFRSLSI